MVKVFARGCRKPGLFILSVLSLSSCSTISMHGGEGVPLLDADSSRESVHGATATSGLGGIEVSGGTIAGGGISLFSLLSPIFIENRECDALRRVGILLPYSDDEVEQITAMGLEVCIPRDHDHEEATDD